MRTKVIGVIVTVFMATALFGGMVYAAPPAEKADTVDYRDREALLQVLTDLSNAADPATAFRNLPQEAQEAVRWAADNGTVTTKTEIGADVQQSGTIACRHHIRTLEKRDITRALMLSFRSSTWWCRNLDTGEIHRPRRHMDGQGLLAVEVHLQVRRARMVTR